MDKKQLSKSETAGSPDRFGYEWGTYNEVLPIYEEQFRRWTPHFSANDWTGKSFLDVGCGMGRNSYWPMTYGAASSLSIDIDDRSLAAAKHTLSQFETSRVRRASAYEIDEVDKFDITFSIGVIHHLEKPDQALAQMTHATKPGGKVAIWVYGLENNRWIIVFFNPLRKALFSWLPIKLVHFLSLFPTALLWALLKMGFGRTQYMKLIRNFSFPHLRSIVFDQMLPQIANYWPKEKVHALLSEAGLEDIKMQWVNEMSWAAVGTKPVNGGDADQERPETQ